jgi:hypothetical protein
VGVQKEQLLITVAVHDGEIELKAPRFGDYLDMYTSDDVSDDEAEEVLKKPTATRERFLAFAEKLITRWSWPEPVTRENIACLDAQTSTILLGKLNELLGVGQGEGEAKKAVTV